MKKYLQQERPHFQLRTLNLYCRRKRWMKLNANVPIWIIIVYNDNWRDWNTYFGLTICITVKMICYLAYRIRINKVTGTSTVPPPPPLPGCHTPCPAPVQQYIPVMHTPLTTGNWAQRSLKKTQMPFIKFLLNVAETLNYKKYRFFGYHRQFSHNSLTRTWEQLNKCNEKKVFK